MRRKKVVIALCLSLCLVGMCTGCSSGKSSETDTTIQMEETTKNVENQNQNEEDSEIIEDVKTYEVDPNGKAEFSFDGEQGEGAEQQSVDVKSSEN